MSTRYNTGNPIESTDVRDMSDNAKNLDLFSNSSELSFDDRFGVERKTIHGMNSEFDAQILNMGFTRVGTFLSGATLTNPRQTLLWDIADGGDGQEYGWSGAFLPSGKVVPPGSTPLTTGGIAVGAWMSRFDPALRVQTHEALRRSYAEAGYNLVNGSFETGGMLVNPNDVLLHEATGKAFSGPAGHVAAGTDPSSGGFVDESEKLNIAECVNYGSSNVGTILGTLIHAGAKGVKYGNSFDNTAALQSIIDTYGNSGRAYTVQFEAGVVCSGALNFRGTKNITFRGASNQYGYDTFVNFYSYGTEFRCIAACDIFMKFSEVNGSVSNEAWNGKISDAVVNGNDLADIGVCLNGCSSIFGVAVTGCLVDAVVRGNYSNQSIIDYCCITRNSGNGLRDTGEAYTVSSLNKCNIRQNGGWGIVVENGSNTVYSNSVIEANYVGGIKIFKTAKTGLCQNIVFDNCHVEANGRLPVGDPNYTGNYQMEVGGISTTPLTFGTSPVLIYFKRCLWSITGEGIPATSRNFFKFGSANCVFFDTENIYSDGSPVTRSSVDTTYAGPVNISMGSVSYLDWTPIKNLIGTNFFEGSYKQLGASNQRFGEISTGRKYANRGRTTVYSVDIQSADLPAASGSYDIPLGGIMTKSPLFGDGSVVGLAIAHVATSGTIAGALTLTAHKATGPISGEVALSGCEVTIPIKTSNLNIAEFTPGMHNVGFSNQKWLGARLTASGDFIKSATSVVKVSVIVEQ